MNRPADISGKKLIEQIQKNQIKEVISTPDFVQLSVHKALDQPGSGVRVTYCANENQALHVASGMIIGGQSPLVMMQNQGLHNCINTLRTCGLDARLPLFLMIGQFGREFANIGQDSRLSRRRMVNLLLPILDAMKISTWTIDDDTQIPRFQDAWRHCQANQAPTALVIGHYTAWDCV